MYVGMEKDFADKARVKMPCLAIKQRTGNFNEVELGLDEQLAVAEGKRYFQCDVRLQIHPAPLPPVEAKTLELVLPR